MKRQLLLSLAATLLALPTLARDFQYTYEGKTITYTVIDEAAKTCQVAKYNKVEGNVDIPEIAKDGTNEYTITEIGSFAFYDCSGLTEVTIPNSAMHIDNYAFAGCSSLTSVDISEYVSYLGDGAFSRCTSLKTINVASGNSNYISVDGIVYSQDMSRLVQYPAGKEETKFTVPSSVTIIGDGAVGGCIGLTSVTIPNTVTYIGGWAFEYCNGLTSITIPNSVTDIGTAAFRHCSGLTSVSIPNSVTTIEGEVFSGCSGLTGSLTIPNSVMYINNYAFRGCSGLTEVSIPNSKILIGNHAFLGCSSLTSVTYLAEEPFRGYSNAFDEETYQNATLNYLKSAEEKIAVTEPWRRFVNRIGRDADWKEEGAISEVHANDGAATAVYDMRGVKVGTSTDDLPKGIYIIREGATTRKVAL